MPYNDEPLPSVEIAVRPVLYTHDAKPVYRQIGFAPRCTSRGVQTTGAFPALSQPTRKPKGKGKR